MKHLSAIRAALLAAAVIAAPVPRLAVADNTQVFPLPAAQPSAAANDGHGYINSSGNWVHSPVHTQDGQAPAGASAQCRDGSFSFSQHHQGTCSHHSGVARWLN